MPKTISRVAAEAIYTLSLSIKPPNSVLLVAVLDR